MRRQNLTTRPDEQWRQDLAAAFEREATAAHNEAIAQWFSAEAAELRSANAEQRKEGP